MVLETNRSRLLNVWGGAEEEQRGWEIGWASPPYSLLLAFNNISADAHLSLTCWDQDLGFSDDPLGVWTSDKPISELCAERGVPVEVAAVLTEVSHGIIHFTVTWG